MWNLDARQLFEIAGRTAIVYGVLLVFIRITGKRQIGQMTPFDMIVLLLISNAVQNAMTGPDTSVTGGTVAAVTLLLVNALVSMLRLRWPPIRRFVEGVPVVLIQHGDIMYNNLRHQGITIEELETSLREHECRSEKDVDLAMLEIDGSVSVIRKLRGGKYVKTRKRLIRHHTRPQA